LEKRLPALRQRTAFRQSRGRIKGGELFSNEEHGRYEKHLGKTRVCLSVTRRITVDEKEHAIEKELSKGDKTSLSRELKKHLREK